MHDSLQFQQTGSTTQRMIPDESPAARVLAALLAIGVGTGGYGAALPSSIIQGTTVAAIFAPFHGEILEVAHVSLVEWLIAIRSFFGLSTSDLAAALQVQRPTIYAWMSGKGQPRAAKINRIKSLYRIGKEFRSRIGGGATTIALFRFEDGESVLDKIVDYGESESDLRKVLALVVPDMASSRVSVADLRKRYGFAPRSSEARDAALRDATIW